MTADPVMTNARLKDKRRERGFASAAATVLVFTLALALAALGALRLQRERGVETEARLGALAVTKGQAYHRLLCRHIEDGAFLPILSHHTQSRLEHFYRGNAIVALASGRDPLEADAPTFFNVVYLTPRTPPPFSEQDLSGLPPQAAAMADAFNSFTHQGLIHVKYLGRKDRLPPQAGYVDFSYVVEAVLKSKTESGSSLARGGAGVSRQEHGSRFTIEIRPMRPPSVFSEPRPFYQPPYPALFAE